MEGVSFVDIFDPKVVNKASERDESGSVEVETQGVIGGVVITSGEDLFKLLVGKFSGLFEAIDSLTNFPVDVTVGVNFVLQLVLIDDFLGDVPSMHAHVLDSVERGVQVHVGDAHVHLFCARSGQDTVPVDFDSFEARSFRAGGTRIVCDEVAAYGDPGSVWFVFF